MRTRWIAPLEIVGIATEPGLEAASEASTAFEREIDNWSLSHPEDAILTPSH
jgi:hypothetical protein